LFVSFICYLVKSFLCGFPQCGLTFNSKSELSQHVKEKHPPTCPSCGRQFDTNQHLKEHLETHKEQRKVFVCEHCGKDFTTVWIFHFSCSCSSFTFFEDPDPFSNSLSFYLLLSFVSISTWQKGNLNVHIRVTHLGLRPYVCTFPGCEQSFAYKHLLNRHLHTHQTIKSTASEVHIHKCSKSFLRMCRQTVWSRKNKFCEVGKRRRPANEKVQVRDNFEWTFGALWITATSTSTTTRNVGFESNNWLRPSLNSNFCLLTNKKNTTTLHFQHQIFCFCFCFFNLLSQNHLI
jgi:hypothetical protein